MTSAILLAITGLLAGLAAIVLVASSRATRASREIAVRTTRNNAYVTEYSRFLATRGSIAEVSAAAHAMLGSTSELTRATHDAVADKAYRALAKSSIGEHAETIRGVHGVAAGMVFGAIDYVNRAVGDAVQKGLVGPDASAQLAPIDDGAPQTS